jgi:beta-lactamase regulating signal transducer with metallopeptidase domain
MEAYALILGMFLARAALLLICFWIAYAGLKSHPRARVMLCRIASLALVALPFLSLVSIPGPALSQVSVVPAMSMLSETPLKSEGPAPVSNAFMDRRGDITQKLVIPQPSHLTPSAWTLAEVLIMLWLIGSVVLLIRWIIAFVLTRRMTVSLQAAPNSVYRLKAELCARLEIHDTVRVGVLARASSPLLIGPRPVILLPRCLIEEDAGEDVSSALAHELVHVKAHDWFWSQWLHLVISFLWPIPMAWFLRGAHDASSELVCDHVAASLVGGGKSYAGSLARQSLRALGHTQLATVPMLRRSGIRRRIDLLLSGVSLPTLSSRMMTVAGLLALVTSGVLAGIHLARADDKSPTNDKSWTTYNYSTAEKQDILAKLYGYFQAISSLSYTGTEVTQLGDYYDDEKLVMKTTFVGSGDRYYIQMERMNLTSTGDPVKSPAPAQAPKYSAYAFNGSLFQRLNHDDLQESTLWIQKGPPFYPTSPSFHFLSNNDYFTLPFDFVNRTMTKDPSHPVQLIPDLFKRSENWVLKSRRFQNGTLLGKRGIIMDVQGEDWEGNDTTISVLLDPSLDYYPVAWQFPEAKQRPAFVVSYVITETGTVQGGGQTLPYPKAATISTTIGGKPNWSRSITVDQASLNDIALDDPRFTIDPKRADVVQRYDDPQKPYDYNAEKAKAAKAEAVATQQNAQMAALHIPNDSRTAIVTEGVWGGSPLQNLIVQAIDLCPTASVVLSWNSDGRYIPDPKAAASSSGLTTPPDSKKPWINWTENPPGKSPVIYSNDIYDGIYWTINHGFTSVALLNTFSSGDRPSATQAVIAAMRSAHLRLFVVSPEYSPYSGLVDYALESGGASIVGTDEKRANSVDATPTEH